jgi:hypothetical protein
MGLRRIGTRRVAGTDAESFRESTLRGPLIQKQVVRPVKFLPVETDHQPERAGE